MMPQVCVTMGQGLAIMKVARDFAIIQGKVCPSRIKIGQLAHIKMSAQTRQKLHFKSILVTF